MMVHFKAADLFTVFIILVLGLAVYTAAAWELRASIIILVLGGLGLLMASAQLLIDCLGRGEEERPKKKLEMELPALEDTDPRATFWGSIEIWAWIVGLFVTIQVIGLRLALPLFVLVYARFYGAGWRLSIILTALIAGFILGVYDNIMHVYWPDSYLGDLLGFDD